VVHQDLSNWHMNGQSDYSYNVYTERTLYILRLHVYFLESFKIKKKIHINNNFMKRLRCQRVISLETQVGVTSQIHVNKWANTDPRTCRRWDQVHRRSKHPLLTGCTHREPISNAKVCSQNQCVWIRWTEQFAVKISESNQVNGKNPPSKSMSRSCKWS
jgi:hypothetical protein